MNTLTAEDQETHRQLVEQIALKLQLLANLMANVCEQQTIELPDIPLSIEWKSKSEGNGIDKVFIEALTDIHSYIAGFEKGQEADWGIKVVNFWIGHDEDDPEEKRVLQ
ncbi:hypothetical protein BXY66_1598 [Shimia isoporae]|uniref:Uncharacterized protein n=1 Tax=Shimia isoporae TaxID=647720 RepID=A0A4R1NMB4_9RHOB|nr:hypothetical protein [Shimia isoporae]TCL09547.1 hypothetical protein BXY66_1598 [Shimia isoporae]